MKKVLDRRHSMFNKRLMEKWGYKRDDKAVPPVRSAPLGQSIQGTEDEESQMSKPGYEEMNLDDLVMEEEEIEEGGPWGGNKGDQNRSAVRGAKSLQGAEDYLPPMEEEVDDAEGLLETDRRHPYSAEEGAVDPERLVNRGKTIAATWRQEHDPTPNPQEWQHRTVKYREDPCDRIEKITAGMSDLEAQHKGLWLARAKCGISKRRRDKEKAQREKEFLARKKGDDNHPYPEISDETGSGFSTNVGKETFKESLREMIEQEIRKMLLKEEDDPVVVDIDKDGDMDLMISADFEQGSFETSGPSTDWALTPAQVGAMQETGKMEDDLARGIDLKGVLMNATQGSHPDFLDVLELPAFQKDPRVKEHGY